VKPVGALVLAVFVALLPFFVDPAMTYLLGYMVITCLLALALHLLMGLSGVFSLGQAALFGTGAYVIVVVCDKLGLDGALGLLIVAAAGALLGLLMGAVTMRITDLYLALATLAFGFVLENVVRNTDALGGPQGLSGFDLRVFGLALDDARVLFWVGLTFLYLLIVMVASIRRSKLGRGLMATRESPIAARSIGVDTRRYKLFAFSLSGAFIALAGSLYSAWSLVVDPSVFGIELTLSILAIAIVGGIRSMAGILVVAIFLTWFRNSAQGFGLAESVLLIYGLLIVLSLRFLAQGIGGLVTSPQVRRRVRPLLARINGGRWGEGAV
jgi:branched-chain amino acid transport system permease protein